VAYDDCRPSPIGPSPRRVFPHDTPIETNTRPPPLEMWELSYPKEAIVVAMVVVVLVTLQTVTICDWSHPSPFLPWSARFEQRHVVGGVLDPLSQDTTSL
jgi:hypothetical protein